MMKKVRSKFQLRVSFNRRGSTVMRTTELLPTRLPGADLSTFNYVIEAGGLDSLFFNYQVSRKVVINAAFTMRRPPSACL